MNNGASKSVEPNVADLVNGWLKSYGLAYKLEQESLNPQIDKALEEYRSKSGGIGGNRPDAKLLLRDSNLCDWPILIEYKGYKDSLVKFDSIGQVSKDFKSIRNYAVNGAVHYANAILHYTDYTDIIAVGITGWNNSYGRLEYEIGVYYVSKNNLGAGQKVAEYTDLSFLRVENFDAFIRQIKELSLSPEELEQLKEQRDQEINTSLVKFNNDIYQNETGLSENDRIYLVAASIIATLGIPNKVKALEKEELKSSTEDGNRDGDIISRKIEAFLGQKDLPKDKKDFIVRTLQNTLTTENINKPTNGESQLKRVFCKIVDDLGIYYKIGLTTDFTGKLFNEMYNWLDFASDKLNDVVLTPSYVAKLLVRLARVNKDSYVWDFAAGSAGLLVAAMNEMLADAKKHIKSPDELARKSIEIKARQLLGIEILSPIYMLAILNMILMGDGSSHILNCNSLTDFDGQYGIDNKKEKFPADAFVLNPPYSAEGNGMIFVEKALSMMSRGYAAIIIQNSAGSGKAAEYNRRILTHSTLLASIKMPPDLFIGKSSVQTQIYVFRAGEAHQSDDTVKFIDFSNDGYKRTNRKKASINLRDIDHARERYAELVDLVRFGKSKLSIFTENEYYEGKIDPKNGLDWNQTAPVDTCPGLTDFRKTVADYLAWEISHLLKTQINADACLQKNMVRLIQQLASVKWGKFKLEDLFEINPTKYYRLSNEEILSDDGTVPLVSNASVDNGVMGFSNLPPLNPGNSISCSDTTMGAETMYYQKNDYIGYQHIQALLPKIERFNFLIASFIISASHIAASNRQYDYGHKFNRSEMRKTKIFLPVNEDGSIDFDFMESFIRELKEERMRELTTYLMLSDLIKQKC